MDPAGVEMTAKAAQVVRKGSKNNHLDRLDFASILEYFLIFLGSGFDPGFPLGPILVLFPRSFACINKVYSSIFPYSILSLSLSLYRCWR